MILGAALIVTLPLLPRDFDAQLIHLPFRYAWRRTVPDVTDFPVDRL